MAETLANLYWRVQIDANDVEFVLAPSSGSSHTDSYTTFSDVWGEHAVWILDFDCCKPITLDKSGVAQAASRFLRNDRFYPRPGSENTTDQALWIEFRDQFMETSELLLGQGSPESRLPARWVALVEEWHQESKELKKSPWSLIDFYSSSVI